ncbi:MAG: hypothetical protein LBF57_00900 [Holosporaceae bacterium]|jgi:hypothetical protein|nr:hypothetical protein [Holosporaceae bacterium]
MKRVCFISFVFSLNVLGEDPKEPVVYADISEEAQEEAVISALDGTHGFLGLNFGWPSLDASVVPSNHFTKNGMNSVGVCFGMEHVKVFKKEFLLAMSLGLDFSKKKNKSGNWRELNEEFELQRGGNHVGPKTGTLESSALRPSLAAKCMYLIPKWKSAVGIRLGILQRKGSFSYKNNSDTVGDASVTCYPLFIGIGATRSINNKLGVSLDIDLSLAKKVKKNMDNVTHVVNVRSFDIRLMGTCKLLQKH